MHRRTVVIIAAVITAIAVAVVGLAALLTNGFTYGKISNKVYNVQNVYDEIWNLMAAEGRGNETILTKATPGAEAVFEFGRLDYIRIPECKATLSNHGTLWISIYTGEYVSEGPAGRICEKYVVYEYDCRAKALTISGTENEAFMTDRFLTEYFEWRKAADSRSDHSLDDLGDYSVTVEDLGDHILCSPVAE